MKEGRLKLGTRASKLSLAQAEIVVQLLRNAHPTLDIEIVPIRTLGDRLPPEKRAQIDEKAAFTKDIEDLLLTAAIDLAVHSLKDLPSELNGELAIAATPQREDARDALVSPTGATLPRLLKGAKIGTSSLRRKAQLLRMRNDLQIQDIRGNVETRLRKIAERGLDGVVLAAAGLKRIGESGRISQLFSVYEMVPAVGQGILAVETRKDDNDATSLLSALDDKSTRLAAQCERAFARRLGGDCNVPLGAYAEASGNSLKITGMISSADGADFMKKSIIGNVSEAEPLGYQLAQSLLDSGGRRILEAVAQ